MRQGQQNRRGRGRGSNNSPNNNNNNNNNRKPQNSLSRSYESSGPDVKIRGTAAQIAEKYIALARDASSAGDSVMAENYLQHAEHYNRIIMAAQAQAQSQAQPQPVQPSYHQAENGHGMNGSSHRPHGEGNGMMRDQPQPRVPQHQAPQPHIQPVLDADEPAEAQPQAAAAPREASQPAVAESPKADAPAEAPAAEPETGRRRRRRYPSANGTTRAAAAEAGSANGKAIEAPEDRSSDEALA